MKSRSKWSLRRDRQGRTTPGSDLALAEVLAVRGVLTAEQMERAFQRERARVERNEQCFSIAVFRLPAAKTVGTMREAVEEMATILQNRIRTYDDVGIVDRSSLAVLLPETNGEATWIFADGAMADLESNSLTAECEVYTYPHPDNLEQEPSDPDADRAQGPVGESVTETDEGTDHSPQDGQMRLMDETRSSLEATLRSAALIERPKRLRAVSPLPGRRAPAVAAEQRTALGRMSIEQVSVPAAAMTMSAGSSALATVRVAHSASPSNDPDEDPAPQPVAETRPIRDLAPFFEEPLPLYRRAVDILMSGTALLALSPFIAGAAVLIKVTSPGPIIFAQARAGRGGRPFQFYKLRSMYRDAEERKNALRLVNEKDGPIFKIKNDPRITPVGKIIRKFSIDELPQLFNVLKGDMTLVGPRPPVLAEVEEYETWQRQRLDITGGITCIWQVSGRSDVTFREWMRMDVRYRKKRSLGLDLKLVCKTFGAVFSGKGAY